ncbi:hypothetical protein ACWKW9_19630 [Rhizobium daejeonense]
MLRFFGATVLSFFVFAEVQAQSPNFCRTSFAPGEEIETRFMGLDYAIMVHALAEKYCGAKSVSMGTKFLGHLERNGCGSDTEVYRDVAKSIIKLQSASLKLMAADGDETLNLTKEQVENWAKDTSEQLGGCERLIKLHDSELDSSE